MDAFAPLYARFGDDLLLVRDRNRVSWWFDGQVALVEVGPDGTVAAAFADRPCRDDATRRPCVALYRRGREPYVMDHAGSARLAADVGDFLSGEREPRFVFSALLDDLAAPFESIGGLRAPVRERTPSTLGQRLTG